MPRYRKYISFLLLLTGGLLLSVLLLWRMGPSPVALICPLRSETGPRAYAEGTRMGREAMYYETLKGNDVRCLLCFRKCVIPPGERGFCKNRENREGTLYSVVYGKASALQIDPVEKEPQHHFLPGTNILCVGTAGCNYTCKHCHNWHLSQHAVEEIGHRDLPPEKIVEMALERGTGTISFTYNEPTVFYEYMYDTAHLAKENGLRVIWHSNGAMEQDPLEALLQYTDGVTIDLKGFSEKAYKNSEADLEPVLETLSTIKEHGVWLEIVNLIIPTVNDCPDEIRRMCEWIYQTLGSEVPVHFSRFHPTYKLRMLPATPVETMEKAYDIARGSGLEYVSLGNVPGHRYNSTFCPSCDKRLIHRVHFNVISNKIDNGNCPSCAHPIPGVWE